MEGGLRGDRSVRDRGAEGRIPEKPLPLPPPTAESLGVTLDSLRPSVPKSPFSTPFTVGVCWGKVDYGPGIHPGRRRLPEVSVDLGRPELFPIAACQGLRSSALPPPKVSEKSRNGDRMRTDPVQSGPAMRAGIGLLLLHRTLVEDSSAFVACGGPIQMRRPELARRPLSNGTAVRQPKHWMAEPYSNSIYAL